MSRFRSRDIRAAPFRCPPFDRRAERELGGRFVHREIADTDGLFTEVDRKTSSGVMGLIIDALAREEPLEQNASAREIGPGVLRTSRLAHPDLLASVFPSNSTAGGSQSESTCDTT